MQFSSTEFFQKKAKSSKHVTKMVLPYYCFASFLRREKQEARENTEEHSSLLEGPTNKEQSFCSKKETVTKGNIFLKKHCFFCEEGRVGKGKNARKT